MRKSDALSFDALAEVGEDTDRARLERNVPSTEWLAPVDVDLYQEREGYHAGAILVFQIGGIYSPEEMQRRVRRPREGLLTRFVNLADKPDEAFQRFARQWGRLELPGTVKVQGEPDKLPGMDPQEDAYRAWEKERGPDQRFADWLNHQGHRLSVDAWDGASCYPGARPLFFEPLYGWRNAVDIARRILFIASCLHEDKPLREEDRSFLSRFNWTTEELRSKKGGQAAGLEWIEIQVNQWVRTANATPMMVVDGLLPRFALSTPSLGAALGVQLLLAATSAKSFAVCYGCGEFFTPKRQSRTGDRTYCEECRDHGVPGRDAQRDRYERKRTGAAPRYPRKSAKVDSHPDRQHGS